LCPDLINENLENQSLNRILTNKHGLKHYKVEITLEPSVAVEYDSQILKIRLGVPMQLMQNVTFTKDNIIVDYFKSRFRGDKGKFKVEVYSEK